jgi:hypothetical protein
MAWRPWLAGDAAVRARGVARSIGEALIDAPPARFAGLGAGRAGTALCLGYLAEELPALCGGRDAAIDAAIDGAAEIALDASLFAGFVGVAWLVAHLGVADPDEVDAAVPGLVGAMVDPGLLGGLAGVGVYCVERCPDARATASLAGVIARLRDTAIAQPDGSLAWRTLVDGAARVGVGAAHGAAGIVGVLAKALGAGGDRALLAGGVRWLLAQRVDGGFPAWQGGPRCAPLAWCNGELGIAGVLLAAACAAGEGEWQSEAVAIARAAAVAEREVVDGGLCHGAAGVAHIFGRLWQVTGDPDLGRAAAHWIERAIASIDPASPTLLTGSAGIALALLAATSEREPAWDRLFLLS